MRWFGEDWNAPVCEEGEQVETPFGQPCEDCKRPIEQGDQGIVLVSYEDHIVRDFPVHLDCLMGMVGVFRRWKESR